VLAIARFPKDGVLRDRELLLLRNVLAVADRSDPLEVDLVDMAISLGLNHDWYKNGGQ
jgi:hypothetical protein